MNICSLLPSATEILFALGLGDQVAGITHECDYPPETRSIRVLTRCAFDSEGLTPNEIDQTVRELAASGGSLYKIDEEQLRSADPDLIVTQDLCHVCAITPDDVQKAITNLARKPSVLSLNPSFLKDVFTDMKRVAVAAGIDGDSVIRSLQARVQRVQEGSDSHEPTVGCIEWLEPLWRSGHWVPEMVNLAGGRDVFAVPGKPSRSLSWHELEEKDPDILIFMPCGFSLSRTRDEFSRLKDSYPWSKLKAHKLQQIYLVDANAYFSRSGPRLVEGLELLAEILHPERFQNIAPIHSYVRAL